MGGQVLKLLSEELEEQAIEEGKTRIFCEFVEDGTITPECAARRLGISIADLQAKMQERGCQYPGDYERS